MDALEEHHATAAIARRELFAALVELNRGDDVGCERRRIGKVSAPIGSGRRENARRDGMLIRFLPGETGRDSLRADARAHHLAPLRRAFARRTPG